MGREDDIAEGLELQKNLPTPRYPPHVGRARDRANRVGVDDVVGVVEWGVVGLIVGGVALVLSRIGRGWGRRR